MSWPTRVGACHVRPEGARVDRSRHHLGRTRGPEQMQVVDFRARNFLTFGENGPGLSDLGAFQLLVGPNGSGKTSFLRAIEFVGLAMGNRAPWAGPYVFRGSLHRAIALDVAVRFSEEEQQAAVTAALQGAIREVRPADHQNSREANRVVRAVLLQAGALFAPLFARELHYRVRSVAGHPQSVRAEVRLPVGSLELVLDADNRLYLDAAGSETGAAVDLASEVFDQLYRTHAAAFEQGQPVPAVSLRESSALANSLRLDWLIRRLTPRDGYASYLPLDEVGLEAGSAHEPPRPEPGLIELARFLQNRGRPPARIGLFELLGTVYSSSVLRLSDARAHLAGGRLGESMAGEMRPPNPDRDLPAELFDLKNSPVAADRRRYERLREAFAGLSGLSFDVVLGPHGRRTGPAGADRSPARRPLLMFTDNGFSFPVEYASAGLCELLRVLFTGYGPTDSVLLLDEPALNLHPTKQRELYQLLTTEARAGRNQVFLVTHSPAIVAPRGLDAALRFALGPEGTTITRLRAGSESEHDQVAELAELDPRLVAALFARGIILVTTEAEEAALPVWLAKLNGGVELVAEGVEFLSVHGVPGLARYAQILSAWGVPHRVLRPPSEERPASAPSEGAYTFEDLASLLRTHCAGSLERALAAVSGEAGAWDPLVARRVAMECDPPPAIAALWGFLEPFVHASRLPGEALGEGAGGTPPVPVGPPAA